MKLPQAMQIAMVVLFYWLVSISLVFANKYLVGGTSTQDISLFVAWLQCGVTVCIVIVLLITKAIAKNNWRTLQIPISPLWSKPVLLMTGSFVSMLSFNNLCLYNVHVSFYQVARSLTLIFTVILSVTILKKMVSWRVLGCCLFVAAGFILGVDQESLMGTLSIKGVVFGVTSSLFVALNGIFTKKALEVVEGDTVRLTFYSNLNAVILFIPVLLLTNQVDGVIHNPQLQDMYFFVFLLSTGALGFLISWISALQIHLTSPVTHHISSNTKAVLQTLLAVMYYRESKALLWWLSILMVASGAVTYAMVRMWEDKQDRLKDDLKDSKGNGEKNGHNKESSETNSTTIDVIRV